MAQNSLKDSLLLRDRINIKEVESLYNQQRLTITQVALRFGMSYSYMLELMRNNSIKRRAPNDYRKKISDADLKVIIERYKSGEIIRKLSEDYGVCSDTIRRYLSNAKIPKVPFRRASKIHLAYKEVRQLYINQRLSIEKIASVYGTSFSSIQKVLLDNGITIRRNKITREQLEEIAKRHQNGETVLNLANEFGVSDSSIYDRFKKAKIVFQFPKKILNKEEIIDLYHNQRLPTTKICVIVGVAKPTLLRFMRKNNIPIRTAGQSKSKIMLTEEICNNIKKLYQTDKLSRHEIAQLYDVTQMTIGKILVKIGVEARKRPEKFIPRTMENYYKIKKWYWENNLTQRDIAEVLGVGEITIHMFMKDMGIETRGVSDRLKVRRNIDLASIISQNNELKKWRRNRKGAYNRVICHKCEIYYTRPLSAINEKFHFCSIKCFREYTLDHGIIAGRHPNMSEEKMLSLLKYISKDWRYVGDNTMMIHGRNPDFWDGKTNLIEFFGEPWHPPTDEEKRITHYKRHGYNCMVIWWEELNRNKNTHALENRIREWYATASS